jgi:hypothetical protein
MSQTWIPNTSGALDSDNTLSDSRTYINNAIAALRSSWSGASAPASPVAGQIWIDTDTNIVSMYNGAAWHTIGDADVDNFGLLALAGGTMSGAIAMGNNKITGLATPTAATDASTKGYVDTAALLLAGGTMGGNIVMGANDVTSDHNPVGATALARKAYVDLFLPLAGGTMAATSGINMNNNKVTNLAAGTAGSQDACRMAEFSATLNASTGHDHDGSDSKRVLASNLDTTGNSDGLFVTSNASGAQMLLPWGVHLVAAQAISATYADVCEVTLYVPRTTTVLFGMFTCSVAWAPASGCGYTVGDIGVRVLNAANAQQYALAPAISTPIVEGTTWRQTLAFSYFWTPGAVGNETFTVQLENVDHSTGLHTDISNAVLWCNTIG